MSGVNHPSGDSLSGHKGISMVDTKEFLPLNSGSATLQICWLIQKTIDEINHTTDQPPFHPVTNASVSKMLSAPDCVDIDLPNTDEAKTSTMNSIKSSENLRHLVSPTHHLEQQQLQAQRQQMIQQVNEQLQQQSEGGNNHASTQTPVNNDVNSATQPSRPLQHQRNQHQPQQNDVDNNNAGVNNNYTAWTIGSTEALLKSMLAQQNHSAPPQFPALNGSVILAKLGAPSSPLLPLSPLPPSTSALTLGELSQNVGGGNFGHAPVSAVMNGGNALAKKEGEETPIRDFCTPPPQPLPSNGVSDITTPNTNPNSAPTSCTSQTSTQTAATMESIIAGYQYDKVLQQQYHIRLLSTPVPAVESLLSSACESLNFDIAEMWLRTGPKTHQLTNSHVRPTALDESVRKQVVDVYYGERSAERTHRLSPALCKRAKEAGDLVWVTAHTVHGAQALKCSISDVRTAVAVPVCHGGSGVNVTIIYFSIRR